MSLQKQNHFAAHRLYDSAPSLPLGFRGKLGLLYLMPTITNAMFIRNKAGYKTGLALTSVSTFVSQNDGSRLVANRTANIQ
jgi:hypothetical protein